VTENGAIPSQRSNVRIEFSKEIEDTGKFAKAYVQFTMMVPPGIVTNTETTELVEQLINFLVRGEQSSTASSGTMASLSNVSARVDRLINQES
jgi:hypothetical protein